jgi:N-acetylglucosamine-6-phosphate deacetylase
LRDGSAELCRAIVGWHVEGPFLSAEPGYRGAHNPEVMCDPTSKQIHELRELTGKDPVLLTLAPERIGAIEAIRLATSLGMQISLGHTNASAETIRQAIATGARGFTHLGNALPQQLDRHDNLIWRVLENAVPENSLLSAGELAGDPLTPSLSPSDGERVSAGRERGSLVISLICDSIHVSPALFRLVHRLLPVESIYYTTDAMSAAGAPPGRYTIGKIELEVGEDQIVRQPGKTNFAGSALRPIDGIWRAARMLNRPWQGVWDHFSTRPADLMKWNCGLAVGQRADFCLLQFDAAKQMSSFGVYSGGVRVNQP